MPGSSPGMTSRERAMTNKMPREIAPGVFWIGDCLAQRHKGKIYHGYNAAFLVAGETASCLSTRQSRRRPGRRHCSRDRSCPCGAAPGSRRSRTRRARSPGAFCWSLLVLYSSCPGLTRASIEKKRFNHRMDCRVKPGNDDGCILALLVTTDVTRHRHPLVQPFENLIQHLVVPRHHVVAA